MEEILGLQGEATFVLLRYHQCRASGRGVIWSNLAVIKLIAAAVKMHVSIMRNNIKAKSESGSSSNDGLFFLSLQIHWNNFP